MEPFGRSDIIEEIADSLALGDLAQRSVAYHIRRLPDGSLLVDYHEADAMYLVTVSEVPRGLTVRIAASRGASRMAPTAR